MSRITRKASQALGSHTPETTLSICSFEVKVAFGRALPSKFPWRFHVTYNIFGNLSETIRQRPMRAGCWRRLHANDDKVTACGFRNDVRSRKVVFRPTVWLFREFSVRIINMNGHLCMIDFCSQPEPIFIPFKQLLPHRFPFTRSEVAWPVILAHVKSLFYIGFCR
jgi:hypothetical protein